MELIIILIIFQVHKVVCNVRITPNLELLPMQLSPNAFMFFAHNLGDDYQEPVLEQLAVKFKNETILNQFKDTVTHCITEIEEIKSKSHFFCFIIRICVEFSRLHRNNQKLSIFLSDKKFLNKLFWITAI